MATKKVAFKVEVDTSDVSKSIDKTKTSVKDLGKQTKKASTEMKTGFKGASDNAQQLGSKLGGATGAAVSFATGIKSMTKAAIAFIATPLGAVIAALAVAGAALVSFFKSSEEGQQRLRVISAALSAIWDNMTDVLANLGGALMQLFSGDLMGAMETAKGAFESIGAEIVNDTKAAISLQKAMNDLLVSERELGVERAKVLKQVAEARLAAEDETKSAKERVEALKQAAALEADITAKELANAQERFRILREEGELNKSDEETKKKIADAEAAVFRVQLASLNLNRRLKTEINSLEREIDTERQQRANNEKKRRAEEKKELQELADIKFNLDDKVAKREVEIWKAQQDAKIALMEEGEEKEKAAAELAYERRIEGIMGANEEEVKLLTALEKVKNIEIQAITDKYAAEELAKKKVSDDKLLKQEKAIAKARQDVASSLGSVLGSIASLISQQSKEGVIASKVLAIAQIAIDTAVAITGAIAQAQSVPYPGNLVAIATGVAAVVAGIASAVTTLNTANIPGGGTAAAPSAPPPVSAPAINSVTTNTTELGGTEQAELAPIQAFVVETGITGSQENVNQIEGQATFGTDG